MKNYIPKRILDIINCLKANGFEAYLVGGCVRDFLLNKTPKDFDISTNATVEEMLEVFKEYHIINNNGLKHATVSLRYQDDTVEVTSYRNENDYSIYGDLKKRDLTINAIAYDGEFIDPFGGVNDILNKIIKVCDNDSFTNDYLRILRALRFSSLLGFSIEDNTKELIKKEYIGLEGISKERIAKELVGILEGENVFDVLMEFKEVFSFIIPELKPTINFNQHNKYHTHNVYTHTLYVVSKTKPNYITRIAALLHDIGKPNCFTMDENGNGHFYGHPLESYHLSKKILSRLRFSSSDIDEILYLVRYHDDRVTSKKGIKRLLSKAPNCSTELFLKLIDLQIADRLDHVNLDYDIDQNKINQLLEEIKKEESCLKVTDLEVKGQDLMNLGIYNKKIKEVQIQLLDLIIDEKLENKKDVLLEYIKNILL